MIRIKRTYNHHEDIKPDGDVDGDEKYRITIGNDLSIMGELFCLINYSIALEKSF